MASIIEIDDRVSVQLERDGFWLNVDQPIDPRFNYSDVPAISRALSIVKESPRYQAWLVKQGLA